MINLTLHLFPQVWQKLGNQGEEWQIVQLHVTLQHVHQVIVEAIADGDVGDIAIDDISFSSGACPDTGMKMEKRPQWACAIHFGQIYF